MPDIEYWLGRKYDILAKTAAGEYQRNIAEAGKTAAETAQVGPSAVARQALEAAQTGLIADQREPYGEVAARQLRDQLRNQVPGFGAASPQSEPSQNRQQQPLALPDLTRPPPATSFNTPRGSVVQNPFAPQYGPPAPGPGEAGAEFGYGPPRPPGRGRVTFESQGQTSSYRKGTANVKAPPGKGRGGGRGKSGEGGGPPRGLEAILPALLAASQGAQAGGGAVGPQTPMGGGPPPMASGAGTSMGPPAFARGIASVHPNPGYPFGAGYVFGATAVPGQGSGKVDTVPAMLAPHEAVLNQPAADMLGRGAIAALNAKGAKKMGLRRGTP